jgi:hypothetical protein
MDFSYNYCTSAWYVNLFPGLVFVALLRSQRVVLLACPCTAGFRIIVYCYQSDD